MAEKIEIEKASNSSQNLVCPLCLDIFDKPTILTCGHTFCRKCLKKYDLTHQDIDHMVCPLCREITELSANRVDDLRLNVSIKGCVDDYNAKFGGMNALFDDVEMRPKCTGCKLLQDAVSFCRMCNNYICDKCLQCHQYLTVFEGHEIVSMEDVIGGKASIGHQFEKCSIHRKENKDMFCKGCKVRVCLLCVVAGHKVHEIKNLADFEQELRRKVTVYTEACAYKKAELEMNIQNIEEQRHEVHTAMQKLLDDVRQVYTIKVKELEAGLEEKLRILTKEINALKRSFDDDLNILKSKDRQRIKSISSSLALIDKNKLGNLETDSLSAHILLCDELSAMLEQDTDCTSAEDITEKAQEKRFNPADISSLDLGCISGSDPKLKVIKDVDLRGGMCGMTRHSHKSVAVGYGDNAQGIDIIDSAGGKQPYRNIPNDIKCWDLFFNQNRQLYVSVGREEVHMYSPHGSKKAAIHVRNMICNLKLNRSRSNEVLVANGAHQVSIYDPTGSTLKDNVPTKHKTWQVSSTRSGLIVTSSCNLTNPSVVTVYDRDRNEGKSLQAPEDVYLYAVVDEQDRVYVASVDHKNSEVVIRLYDLDGLNLKERVKFNALDIICDYPWCYLVSLSPDLLAFACWEELYFINISKF
nr:E3 ubiquitin-protein ligase TRIM71-like [Lytechinus pictus]